MGEGKVSGDINDKILAIYRSLLKLVMDTLGSLYYSVHFFKYVCLKLSIKKKFEKNRGPRKLTEMTRMREEDHHQRNTNQNNIRPLNSNRRAGE